MSTCVKCFNYTKILKEMLIHILFLRNRKKLLKMCILVSYKLLETIIKIQKKLKVLRKLKSRITPTMKEK